MDLILSKYLLKNKDYINFFTSKEIDNGIEIRILDLKNINYLYNNFINDIYYFLRTCTLLNLLNINKDDITIDKNNLAIILKDNNKYIFKVVVL